VSPYKYPQYVLTSEYCLQYCFTQTKAADWRGEIWDQPKHRLILQQWRRRLKWSAQISTVKSKKCNQIRWAGTFILQNGINYGYDVKPNEDWVIYKWWRTTKIRPLGLSELFTFQTYFSHLFRIKNWPLHFTWSSTSKQALRASEKLSIVSCHTVVNK